MIDISTPEQLAKKLKALVDNEYDEIEVRIKKLEDEKSVLARRHELLGSISVHCDNFLDGNSG